MADPQISNPQTKNEPLEDIFSDVASNPRASSPLPSQPAYIQPAPVVPAPIIASAPRKKRFSIVNILLIVLGTMAIGLLAVAGYYYWQNRSKTVSPTNTNTAVLEDQGDIVPTNTNIAPININANKNTNAEEEPIKKYVDSDFDGLSDDAEATYETDPNKKDTDDDGLSDREEVKVYLTDPNRPDTDNDGFKDGAEVDGGYNPKGSGYLIDWQDEINKKLNINQ
ncbi:MAG: hypothetical protein WC752_04220 [Patescibacteria group bacterium]|jgi:hypothetical protein